MLTFLLLLLTLSKNFCCFREIRFVFSCAWKIFTEINFFVSECHIRTNVNLEAKNIFNKLWTRLSKQKLSFCAGLQKRIQGREQVGSSLLLPEKLNWAWPCPKSGGQIRWSPRRTHFRFGCGGFFLTSGRLACGAGKGPMRNALLWVHVNESASKEEGQKNDKNKLPGRTQVAVGRCRFRCGHILGGGGRSCVRCVYLATPCFECTQEGVSRQGWGEMMSRTKARSLMGSLQILAFFGFLHRKGDVRIFDAQASNLTWRPVESLKRM